MLSRIREDIGAVLDRDPAARSFMEVVLCYPGLHAVWLHRAAHFFYGKRLYTTARLISAFNRFMTGIEIHPGARLGRRIFIDHGMGIVIGETAEVGDDCSIYTGVVLGGVSLERKKRHPTVGRNVILGSNACVLGAIHVGDGARVGSGSVVVGDVPPGATVVGVPGRVVERKQGETEEGAFEHGNLPDPISDVVKVILGLQKEVEKRVERLEKEHGIDEPKTIMDIDETTDEL